MVDKVYKDHTNMSVYTALGNVDFDKARMVVLADDIYEAEQIRKGLTDIRMWDLESES
jgi:hypothetical protein